MIDQVETITAIEVARKLSVSKRILLRRAERESWPYRNGDNRAKRFILADLPEGVKLEIMKSKTPRDSSLYNREPVSVGSPELSDAQNRVSLARADLIRPYLEEKARAKSKKESVVEAGQLFIKGYNTGRLLPTVFDIIGTTSKQTVEAWVKKFRDANYDYAVLAPQYGNRLGQRKVTDDEFNTMLSFALHPNRLRIAEVARLTKTSLRKRQIPSPSSKDTLRRCLNDWKKTHFDQWIFCREGEKALNDKCLPYMERDIGLLDVGDVLVADGHTLNFEVLHPFTGKPTRMTWLVWYDWASCMPVGWEIMPTENVQCVAAGLRRAILALGKMPKVAYLDNGKAFKAKLFTSTEIDFEEAGFYGMFARLGIETIFAWPYHAQSKPVERFFGTFSGMERMMPTFTGTSIADKPAYRLRSEKLHKKIHEKKYGGWVPTIEETHNIIVGWVNEYANRAHRGLKGLCPGEVLLAGRGKGIDETALRFLMMSLDTKQVHRNGVKFNGRNYYDEALYGLKDRVMIRYDLEDLSSVYVYDKTGKNLICEAPALKPVHPVAKLTGNVEDIQAVKDGIRLKRSMKKQTESVARTYVENQPTLIEVQGSGVKVQGSGPEKPRRKAITLPRAEAERIEIEASQMEVLEISPRDPEPMYMSEADRYEALMENECKGADLALDDMQFMRYFEKTKAYDELKDRFEFLREHFIAPEEEVL